MAQLKGLVHHVPRAAAMGFPRMMKAIAMAIIICRDKKGIAPAKTPAAKPRAMDSAGALIRTTRKYP